MKDIIDKEIEAEIGAEIVAYVEAEIVPRYAGFDKAHREDHVRMVMRQSLEMARTMPDVDPTMAYVVAAFHDLGLVNGRENHHRDSRKILENDSFIRERFSSDDIRLMGEAVEDHRASGTAAPRNRYGLIVAEADRFIDPETIIRRTIQYGLSHYPELDRRGQYERTMKHLAEKYGRNGYLRIWIPGGENERRLHRLQEIMDDKEAIAGLFDRIFDEEIKA